MIPRHEMPQIAADKLNDFLASLRADGIKVSRGSIKARALKPVQMINPEKVAGMKDRPEAYNKPVIVARDWRIVDGHHRWATCLELDKPVNYIRIEMSFDGLRQAMHDYEHSFIRHVHEAKEPDDADDEEEKDDETETDDGRPLIQIGKAKTKIKDDLTDVDLVREAEEKPVPGINKDALPEARDSRDAERLFRSFYMRAKSEVDTERRMAYLSIAKSYLSKSLKLDFDERNLADEQPEDEKEKKTVKNEAYHYTSYVDQVNEIEALLQRYSAAAPDKYHSDGYPQATYVITSAQWTSIADLVKLEATLKALIKRKGGTLHSMGIIGKNVDDWSQSHASRGFYQIKLEVELDEK